MDRRRRVIVVVMVVVIVVMIMVVVMVVIAVRAAGVIMVMIVLVEEVRIVFQRPFQVEGALIEDLGKIDVGALGAVDAGRRIDDAHGRFDALQFLRRDQVGLVEKHDVGKGDLVFGLAAVL
ncbi:hypothetical protein D9M72_379000 [compost metagenome]